MTTQMTAAREVEIGDVLMASWGYEQTNIDYYMVIELVGKVSVKIVKIGAHREETGFMSGICTPDKTTIIGEPMKKRVKGTRVKIDDVCTAYKITPEIMDGQEVYKPNHWTAYY